MLTDGRTYGRKTESLYRAMPEADATKISTQETWKFHENQVFQQLYETKKIFQVQIIQSLFLCLYLCFSLFRDESRVN